MIVTRPFPLTLAPQRFGGPLVKAIYKVRRYRNGKGFTGKETVSPKPSLHRMIRNRGMHLIEPLKKRRS